MKNKKKGVLLIYVLSVSVLICIFLLTAVGNMNNSFFLTKRFTGENRAYWAAQSGIQYCAYKLKSDLGWPFFNAQSSDNNKTGTEIFGKFKVTTSKEDGGNGYYIYGKSSEDEEEFCIYFSKREDSILGSEDISIVPSNFPSEPKNLSYCSYTCMQESDIKNFNNTSTISNPQNKKISPFVENEENKKVIEKNIIVSKSPVEYKTIVSSLGIYIVSDGRCGAYRSVIETMFVADNGNSFGAGIYAGGNIDLILSGNDSSFKVSNGSNSKPEIYCKGDINIYRNNKANSDSDYSFPTSIGNGQIYFGKGFNIIDRTDEGKSLTTKRTTINDFKREYGINLEKYPTSKEDLFPKIKWSNVEKIKENQENKKEEDGSDRVEVIKSGSYVAIFESDGEKPGFTLCRLDKNYMKRDGKFSSDQFKIDLETAKENREIAKARIKEQYTEVQKDEHGNVIGSVFKEPGPTLYAKKNTDRGLIEEFLKNINGLATDEEARRDILASNGEESKIFSIDTVNIDDKLTPIITLKKSVKTLPFQNMANLEDREYFNLFTLTKNNNKNDFDIDETTSTDLIFKDKTNGISERQLLLLANDEKEEDSLIPNADTTMLYTEGYVSINGKLSGTGQILSSGSIYFKAGSQLNTAKSYTAYVPTNTSYGPPVLKKTITIPSSKLALYSKGTIQMGNPEGKGNLTALYEKLKEVFKEKSSRTYTNLIYNALNTEVEITKEDKKRVSIDFDDEKILLKDCMTKYYGYTLTESKNFLENIVRKNAYMTMDKKGNIYYNMPKDTKNIKIECQSPSSFSGVIYACGGFKCNAEYNDIIINGVLVTYGSEPTYIPGNGKGLNKNELLDIKTYGGIEIENCNNFAVVYTSSDLNSFMKLCGEEKPVNLTKIYYNEL